MEAPFRDAWPVHAAGALHVLGAMVAAALARSAVGPDDPLAGLAMLILGMPAIVLLAIGLGLLLAPRIWGWFALAIDALAAVAFLIVGAEVEVFYAFAALAALSLWWLWLGRKSWVHARRRV